MAQGIKDEPDVPGPLSFLLYHPEFSPVALTADGKTVACNLDLCGIRLYEVATGKELAPLRQLSRSGMDAPAPGQALAFSPDCKQLASVDNWGTVTLWDWANAKELRSFATPTTSTPPSKFWGVPILAYSPDGKRLLTMSIEGLNGKGSYFLRLWDPDNGSEIWKVPVGDKMGRLPADFSPDGQLVALAGTDGSVTIFEADTGKVVRKLQNETPSQNTIRFGSEGKTLFTHDRNLNIFELDTTTGKKLRDLGAELPKRKGTRFFGDLSGARMALSPDAATLAVCGMENAPHFIDLATGKTIAAVAGPLKSIQTLQFGPDGKRLWTRSLDNIFRLWEPATGKELRTLSLADRLEQPPTKPAGTPTSGTVLGSSSEMLKHALISPDGKFAVQVLSANAEIQVIDIATDAKIAQLPPRTERDSAEMRFTPDGKTLIARWFDAQVFELLDFPTLKQRLTIGILTGTRVKGGGIPVITARATIVSPNSQRLAAYSAARTFSVWEMSSGKKLLDLVLPERRVVHDGAFTPDGRCLAINLNDGTIILYELATSNVRHVFGQIAAPRTPFAPGMINMTVGTWGPEYSDTTAITPDGKALVHAGLDRKLRFWDLVTGKELAALGGHTATIKAIAFSPDGKLLASASDDTTALVWDMSKVPSPPLPAKALSAAELEERWGLLKRAEADVAFDAMRNLIASSRDAVAFFAKHLKPSPPTDGKLIEQYVADLSSADYKTRQRASAELLKFGEVVVPAIEKALAVPLPLEPKTRLEQLRATLTNPLLSEEKLRVHRTIEVLERMGSSEARQLLVVLADGAPGAYTTTTAVAALERLRAN